MWREDIQHHLKHAKNHVNHDVRFELIGSATRSGNATIDALSSCKGLFFDIYAGYCPPSLWLCHDQTSKWHLSSRCKIVSNIFRVQPYEQPTPSWINSYGRLFVYIMLFVVHTSSAKCGPSCNIYGMKSKQ